MAKGGLGLLTPAQQRDRLEKLRNARTLLLSLGNYMHALEEIDYEIGELNHPRVGETMYRGVDRQGPVRIIGVHGTTVEYVHVDTEIHTTHQGNLCDENGVCIYRTAPWASTPVDSVSRAPDGA